MDYSVGNLRKAFDLLNKRSRLDKVMLEEISGYKEYSDELRGLMDKKKKENDRFLKADIDSEIKELKRKFSLEIDNFLEELSNRIYKITEFGIQAQEIDETTIYTTKKSLETTILLYVLNKDLRNCYKIHPANRNTIIKTVKSIINNSQPMTILRLDIKSFYESIPLDDLNNKIADDAIACYESIRLLDILFSECNKKGCKGVPRGISCSAFLSEIYMRDIDHSIKSIDGVYYYQRYVDDIILFATPKVVGNGNSLYDSVAKIVNKYGLCLHAIEETMKTAVIDNSEYFEFDYLGYHIVKNVNGCHFFVSQNKIDKICKEIGSAVSNFIYNISKHHFLHQSPLRILLLRLKKLTGNYHLTGNKQDVMTGIFFKYPMLTDIRDLEYLDEILRKEIDVIAPNIIPDKMGRYPKGQNFSKEQTAEHIKRQCLRYSFVDGFTNKRKVNITNSEFRILSKIKRNEA